jgi:arylsulfatase A-like enzyme
MYVALTGVAMNGPFDVRRVVLVVLDGLRPDAIDAFDLVHIRRLAANGASTYSGRTVTPSITAAAMTTLLTGLTPARHGIVSERFHIPRVRGSVYPLPRILAAAGYPTEAFVGALPPLYRGLASRIGRYLGIDRTRCAGAGAQEILAEATAALTTRRRGLFLLHWPDADRAGHAHGWMSREYAAGARALDAAMAALVKLLQPDDGHTLLIALADHGGGGVVPTDHESDHPADWTIPIMISGCGVRPGDLCDAATLVDIPATVLGACGISVPAGYEGRPILRMQGEAVAAA